MIDLYHTQIFSAHIFIKRNYTS